MYLLKVDTWENDGDDSKTMIVEGLTKPDAEFLKDICSEFSSKNCHRGGMGNEAQDEETLCEMVTEKLMSHPFISEVVRTEWQDAVDNEAVHELLCDVLLGWAVQYDESGFCRVVERCDVEEYLPPVVAEHTIDWVVENPIAAYKALRNSEEGNRVWALKWQEQADQALQYKGLLQKVVDLYNSPNGTHIDYMNFIEVIRVILNGSEAEQLVALLKIGSAEAKAGKTISEEELLERLRK